MHVGFNQNVCSYRFVFQPFISALIVKPEMGRKWEFGLSGNVGLNLLKIN